MTDPLLKPDIVRELTRRYLIFDAHVAGRRRVEIQPLVLPRALHERAVRAAEGVVRTVGRAAGRAHIDPIERGHYAFHHDVLRLMAASRESGDDAALMRVDLLLSEDGDWRACEINADCPGGHNESLGLPMLARMAGFREASNPTQLIEPLAARLAALAAHRDETPGVVALVYATAYAEDLQVCAIVQRALERRGTRAVLLAPTALRFERGELLTADNEVVRVLYRYFPTEYMEGQNNLDDIYRAVREGRVRTLSSFAHMFTQSKLSFARAWAQQASLVAVDRGILHSHIPRSFDLAEVARDELVFSRTRWVLKRALGRVGDEVFVGALMEQREWVAVVDAIREMRTGGESWVAQEFVRQRPVPTPWGDRFVTLGAYVMDGRFVGYFARITPESHVSHSAVCVPVFAEVA